jgi:hypothetical protein
MFLQPYRSEELPVVQIGIVSILFHEVCDIPTVHDCHVRKTRLSVLVSPQEA